MNQKTRTVVSDGGGCRFYW